MESNQKRAEITIINRKLAEFFKTHVKNDLISIYLAVWVGTDDPDTAIFMQVDINKFIIWDVIFSYDKFMEDFTDVIRTILTINEIMLVGNKIYFTHKDWDEPYIFTPII